MPSSNPIDRFNDIIDNVDAIASYTAGMTREQFLGDRTTYDATERCLSRISEAATKLGLLAEEFAPDQPRNDIRGIGPGRCRQRQRGRGNGGDAHCLTGPGPWKTLPSTKHKQGISRNTDRTH